MFAASALVVLLPVLSTAITTAKRDYGSGPSRNPHPHRQAHDLQRHIVHVFTRIDALTHSRTHADAQVVSIFLDDADSVSGQGNFDCDPSTEKHCYLTLYAFQGNPQLH